ncbi:MAG TPA: DUF4142 domain-containing protein [Candidatus Baltobacteraceae bacterium]|jgi:putative membrane protein|nr:DUF4142 domain-containing protein [Candidatus Baltobacteraceae bacterium]
MKLTASLLTLALAAALTGGAQAASASSTDATFVQTAQQDLLGQYALAALAQKKAQDTGLKSTATEIATATGKANDFIKSYASTHNVTISNKPTIRTDAQYGEIVSLSGKAFDQKYAQVLNTDVQLELSDFQDEAQNGTDPALKAFAKQQAALLQQAASAAQKAGR